MKLKEIIPAYKVTFNEVFGFLQSQYGDDMAFKDEYAHVYDFIKSINSTDKNVNFKIGMGWIKDDIDNEEYVDVYGYNENGECLAIEFVPWEDWCNAELTESTMKFSPIEIIANCLYEMTFIAFDEETIQNKLLKMEEDVKEICKTLK